MVFRPVRRIFKKGGLSAHCWACAIKYTNTPSCGSRTTLFHQCNPIRELISVASLCSVTNPFAGHEVKLSGVLHNFLMVINGMPQERGVCPKPSCIRAWCCRHFIKFRGDHKPAGCLHWHNILHVYTKLIGGEHNSHKLVYMAVVKVKLTKRAGGY